MCILNFKTNKIFHISVLVILLVLCLVYASNIEHLKHRVKRKVMFTSSSKFFFRLNGKVNNFNYSDIFAFGYSIRVNYDLPSSPKKRFKFFKRDIHGDIDKIPNEFVLHGVSCLMKQFCQVLSGIVLIQSCGFLCDIGNIIAREEGVEGNFFRSFIDKCEYYEKNCPSIAANHSLLIN